MKRNIEKTLKAAAIILGIMAIIRKAKISMFADMDKKMKALGFPVLVAVVANYLIKKEEYSQPITIGALIAFVSGVLEVTGSDKFKQEDLGLAGEESQTINFGSMEELENYIKANQPMQGYLDNDMHGQDSLVVSGNEIEIQGEVSGNDESDLHGSLKLDEIFGDLNGSHNMQIEA